MQQQLNKNLIDNAIGDEQTRSYAHVSDEA